MLKLRSRVMHVSKTLLTAVHRKADPLLGTTSQATQEIVADAVSDDPKLCFLCFGNICRSPFAARYCRQLEIDAVSAGFYPEEGRPSPDAAIEVATEFGVDLKPHRSVCVSEEMVNRADLVFLMDCRNLVDYKLAFHDQGVPVAFLGKLNKSGPMIDDPHGSTVPEFQRTYRQIAAAVDTLPELLSESVE